MNFDPVLAHRRAAQMRELGLWKDKTMHDYFRAALAAIPDKTAIVDHAGAVASTGPASTPTYAAMTSAKMGQGRPRRLSYRQLDSEVDRIARMLLRLEVVRGDVVSVQLHNCWQHLAVALACARIGAVVNPLMPIFRERELEFMLNLCETSVLIVPDAFRGRDHAGMVRALRPRLPHLRHLLVLGGTGFDSFDAALELSAGGNTDVVVSASGLALHPDDVALVMFTSGTTGEPKGVMHTSNTMLSTLDTALLSLAMTPDDVALCSAPMGHLLGFALLGIFPMMAMGTTVIMDTWDVARATKLMRDENVTFVAGPTPYLADLCSAVAAGAPRPEKLRVFCCAGAPIPPVLIERADSELNITVCSLWGMTEVQAGTITGVAQGRRYSAVADGRPPVGMEVRIVGDDGVELAAGQTGRFLVRGNGVFAGYLKHPELNATDDAGWFDTGDLAYVVNDDGYIRINGRTKDIIKRGGESVPVVEVEALLARHPAIAAAAIVGWPDARLGERVCAFVSLRPGATFSLEDMRGYLSDCRLTPQYWPEIVEYRDDLPRTPSGKVQKYRLRDAVRKLAGAAGPPVG